MTRIIPERGRSTALDVERLPDGRIRVTAINVFGGDGLTRQTTRSTSVLVSPEEAGQVVVALLQSGATLDGPHGHCDTCGAPCDQDGCTRDRTHVPALDVDDPLRPLTLTRGALLDLLTTACLIGRNEDYVRNVLGWTRGDFTVYLAARLRGELDELEA